MNRNIVFGLWFGLGLRALKKMDTELRDMDTAGRSTPHRISIESLPPAIAATGQRDWPGFRGPNRDAICSETGLLRQWPAGGPRLLWKREGLGRGYATVSIAGDRLFTLGDRRTADGAEVQFVICFDRRSQQEVWAARIGPPHADGGPRCTPTVDGERLHALGTDGNLVCLEAGTSSGSAAVLYADGHLIFRYDRGPLVLVEAHPKEFRVKGRLTPPTDAGPARVYPVVHEKRLYLRHSNILLCYDLSGALN
jgi:hypothetical protein